MTAIHLIERLGNCHIVDKEKKEYESGFWVVGEETAQKLIGGDLYLHPGQHEPSHFGGKILSYRVHRGGELDGRIIFRLKASVEHKGVRTGKEGWGNEKKIVL